MIGQIFDNRYRIEALVGRGGTGHVYRATDLTESQPVALKVLRHYLDAETETALTRFRREFRVLARLDHPHIVRAYASGTYHDMPYVVLEFLEGRTLKEELNDGPLPRARLLYIAQHVCQALAYLHARSIVHRDLKPGNLMLLNQDSRLWVKLMDFGLVRVTDVSAQLTQEGAAFGTVVYMAPEQAQGLSVDFRADLYAFGVILFEMATGRPPFYHENPAVLMMQQLTAAPPLPRQFNPNVDEPLEMLILQLLAREPAQRPANAESVARRLAGLADESAPVLTVAPPDRCDLIPRVPLIGQETTLSQLNQAWSQARANQGRVVFVVGAAGSGKTRLITEASLPVRAGSDRFLSSHCREHASLPYQPLLDIVDVLVREMPISAQKNLPIELARLLPGSSAAAASAEMALTGQADARLRLFAACWQLVGQAARNRAMMLAVEDLQWADPSTLELLGYLAQRIDSTPLLLTLTYRPEEVEPDAPLLTLQRDLSHYQQAQTIALDPLTRDQVANFLQLALGRHDLPAWFVESFHLTTGGNPFFIEETLKALAAEGQVAEWARRDSKQWTSLPTLTLQLPQNVLSLAERRLRQLAAEDRAVLTAAAVLGPEFNFSLLQRVATMDEDSLLDVIDRLLAARLIEELPLQDGEDRYRFVQEALRQALQNGMSQRRLRRLHQRAGQMMQKLYDTSRARYWPALAYHFFEAGHKQDALKYFALAGDAAAKVYANAEAVAHYTRALEIARSMEANGITNGGQLGQLYTNRGRSLELDSQFDEALANYSDMAEEARRRGDRTLELAALLAQATVRSTPNRVQDLQEAERLSRQALTLAREGQDLRAEAKALWNLLLVHSSARRWPEALACGEQSLRIARQLGLKEQLAFTLHDIHSVYLFVGQPELARTTSSEARDLWRELGNLPMLADSLANETVHDYLSGNYEHALTLAAETQRISRDIGNPWGQAHGQWVVGPIYFESGRPDKAIEVMEETIRLSDEGGLVPLQVSARSNLGWLYGSFGDLARGFDLVGTAQATAEQFLPAWRPLPLAIQARLHLLAGDIAAAESAIAASYVGLKSDSIAAIFVAVADGELTLVKQAYDRVISQIDTFLARLRELGIRSVLAEALYLKGQALLAQGWTEAARTVLGEARAEAETLGQQHHLWPILVALSQIEQNPASAADLQQQARQIIERIAEHIRSPELRASYLALPQIRAVLTN